MVVNSGSADCGQSDQFKGGGNSGASLGEGPFDGTLVKCPLHGFRVDVWKGKGNAGKPVQTFPVEIVGDHIHLTVPD